MRQTEDQFVAAARPRWRELDRLLGAQRELHGHDGATIARIAGLYRSTCTDLMRGRSSGFTPELLGYLDALAARAHNALYGARPLRIPAFWRMLTHGFPAAVRRNAGWMVLSLVLFGAPCAVGVVGALSSPAFAAEILPQGMLEQMAESYSKGFAAGRGSGTDAGMAGFYVYNNVGIAFRCFATGILFGLGSLFFLVYNGLVIGTVAGYVMHAGHGANILTFMSGHAPFELGAIIVSGAAGMRMGYALVSTGGRTRLGSLRHSAGDLARLIIGAAVMLVIAAGIEAFWSPSSLPPPAKWAASGIFTLLLLVYWTLAGRRGVGA